MSDSQVSLLPVEFEDATDEAVRAEILKFYREHPEQTLKTLVCRAYGFTEKEYVALVIRGDLKINMDKVSRARQYKSIRLANPDEMKKLNLVVGYVSPIDCTNMKVIGDNSITQYQSYYDGGNRKFLYRKNVNFPRDFSVVEMLDMAR